ncbi:hypothetical protein R1sor_017682 [Riccia sorocarpa]|uniref:Uncharacterized protein n=1 Tax=Riccia sorocarpa TaxID=122646 RepID=A0ABD3I7I9_9MARC
MRIVPMRILMGTRHDEAPHGDATSLEASSWTLSYELGNNGMDRGEESPTRASSDAEEVHVEDLDQDADPNANPHDEDDAASEDEPGLEPTDMQQLDFDRFSALDSLNSPSEIQ